MLEKIYHIRDQKVMLDIDLAVLYEVQMRALKLAVKRNHTAFSGRLHVPVDKRGMEAGYHNW